MVPATGVLPRTVTGGTGQAQYLREEQNLVGTWAFLKEEPVLVGT